jgi:hypothetical protein
MDIDLKGLSSQIRSTQEFYNWIGLDYYILRCRFVTFYLILNFSKDFKALIYLITNGLGDRQESMSSKLYINQYLPKSKQCGNYIHMCLFTGLALPKLYKSAKMTLWRFLIE